MFNDPQFTILLSDAPLDFFCLNCLLLVFCWSGYSVLRANKRRVFCTSCQREHYDNLSGPQKCVHQFLILTQF